MTNYNIKLGSNNQYNTHVPSEKIYNIKVSANNNYKASISEKQV